MCFIPSQDSPIKSNANRPNILTNILHDLGDPLQTLALRSQCTSALQSNQMPTQSSPTNLAALLPAHSNIVADRREVHLVARRLSPSDSQASIQDIARVVTTDYQRTFALLATLRLAQLDRIENLRRRRTGEDIPRHVGAQVVAADESAEHGLVAAAGKPNGCDVILSESGQVIAVDCLELLVV